MRTYTSVCLCTEVVIRSRHERANIWQRLEHLEILDCRWTSWSIHESTLWCFPTNFVFVSYPLPQPTFYASFLPPCCGEWSLQYCLAWKHQTKKWDRYSESSFPGLAKHVYSVKALIFFCEGLLPMKACSTFGKLAKKELEQWVS